MNMKNLLRLSALLLLLVAARTHAQDADHSKFASVDIHSNAVCGMCETTIETEMLYVKGVQAVKVDLNTNIIHVEYRAKKTDPDKLRQAVAKLGYMADDIMPDAEARKALPDCCQAEGCGLPHDKKDHGAVPESRVPATAPAETLPVTPATPEAPVAPPAPER